MKRIIRSAARDDILRQFRYYLVDQARPEVAERGFESRDQAGISLSVNQGALQPVRVSFH